MGVAITGDRPASPEGDTKTAWLIVLVAAIGHVFVVGAPGAALPMIYGPVIDEFGLSRSAVSIMASVKMIAGALLAIGSGWIIRQWGLRALTVATTAIAGLSLIAYLWVRDVPTLYVVTTVMGGSTVLGMVAFSVMVSRWFNNNLGLAIALASLGTSIGGAATPFLMNYTISEFGWRAAMAFLGPGCLICVPLILIFFRSPQPVAAVAEGAPKAAEDPAPLGSTPRQVLMQPTFWLVGLALFLSSLADQSLIQHLVLYLRTDVHLSATIAAAALALTFSGGFAGKLVFGFIFDRFSIYGLAFCYAVLALGAWLMSPLLVAVFPVLIANTLRGLAHGGIIVDVPVAARHCFGPRVLGYVIGLWSAATSFGAALGPYVVGLLRDKDQNYGSAFVLIIVAALAAAVLMMVANPAYRRATRGKVVAF